MNFVSPTPENGTIRHTDYVDVAVEIAGPVGEASELVTVFDNASLNFSDGTFVNTALQDSNFINLSDENLVGNFTPIIFDVGADTVWDNISWSEILPTDGKTVPNGNTVLLFHLNNDSNFGENDTHIFDFSNNGNNGTAVGAVPTPYGNISGGFEFDGVDDYVDAGSGDSIDDVHTFIWEAWVRPHLDTDGQSHRVIVKGTGGGQKS